MPFVQGRKRRADPVDEVSPEQSPEPPTQRQRRSDDASDNEDFGASANAAAMQGNMEEMVKKMVRLALACEYQRRSVRRADISEKVLGPHGRQFKAVFNEAQLQLRTVFGMEMVELPAREKITLQQRRAAKNASQQSKPVTSWVLTSILPSHFRDPAIIPPPAAPTAEEDSKYTAIYTLLVSLISLSGGTLPDAKMERYLRRLNIEDNSPIAEYERTEKLFKRLEKDGYIMRIKESTGTGEDDVYWVVGPRGKIEIGDDGVRGLTKTVFGDLDTEEEEEELEQKIRRSLGMNERVSTVKEAVQPEIRKRGRPRRNPAEEEDDEEGENEDEDE